MKRSLYICYFGVREPLVQTQVLPYLREISKISDLRVGLLTYEPDLKKWTAAEIAAEKKSLAGDGIGWHHLAYHKRPSAPATLFDVLNGARYIIQLARKENIDILHARAHVPMLMAMLAGKITKSELIFDIRGLMAEEYADAGVWAENSKPFRFVKRIERRGIERASQIVVLTDRMKDYLVEKGLKKSGQIEVIPCCVDFSRIGNSAKAREKSDRFELIYAGSVTGLYLLKEMGEFFLELKRRIPDAFFRILTASPHEFVRETFGNLELKESDYAVARVASEEVPGYLKRASLGISFRTRTFAQIASSPTKIPEYLACGLPVVSNRGIGDTDRLLEGEGVGVSLDGFEKEEITDSVEDILRILSEDNIENKCIGVARKYFDLAEVGGKRYRSVYRCLIGSKNSAAKMPS